MSLFNIHNQDPNFIAELVLASNKTKMDIANLDMAGSNKIPFRLFCLALVHGKLGKILSFFQPKKTGIFDFFKINFVV
jgi:hypothetical protein